MCLHVCMLHLDPLHYTYMASVRQSPRTHLRGIPHKGVAKTLKSNRTAEKHGIRNGITRKPRDEEKKQKKKPRTRIVEFIFCSILSVNNVKIKIIKIKTK